MMACYIWEWIRPEKEPGMASTQTVTGGEGTFTGVGGLTIFFRSWRPSITPRGVVAIVPGFNSHSGYYDWVANELVARGLAVCAVDLRGRAACARAASEERGFLP
jgi:alpha-beta hydrolase superfamily lysophospholipase